MPKTCEVCLESSAVEHVVESVVVGTIRFQLADMEAVAMVYNNVGQRLAGEWCLVKTKGPSYWLPEEDFLFAEMFHRQGANERFERVLSHIMGLARSLRPTQVP